MKVLRDTEGLAKWLAARPDVTELKVDGEQVAFSHMGDRESEAALLKLMVEAGFSVIEFGARHQSLEDVFLQAIAKEEEHLDVENVPQAPAPVAEEAP